jgi:hypothetical protein
VLQGVGLRRVGGVSAIVVVLAALMAFYVTDSADAARPGAGSTAPTRASGRAS